MKFMQSLPNDSYRYLEEEAKKRGVRLQELLRVVVIPEWREWKTDGGESLAYRNYMRKKMQEYRDKHKPKKA